MNYLWIVAGVLVCLIAISMFRKAHRRRRIIARVRSRWGVPRISYTDTVMEQVARYHNLLGESDSSASLSDQTWDDLNLDDVYTRVDHAQCGAGQQYLYHMLRTPEYRTEPLEALERLVQDFGDDHLLREQVQAHLHELDRRETYYLPNLFLKTLPARIPAFWLAPLLTLLAIGLLGGMFFYTPLFLGVLVISAFNLLAQLYYKRFVYQYVLPLRILSRFIYMGPVIAQQIAALSPELASEMTESADRLQKLRKLSAYLRFEGSPDRIWRARRRSFARLV